MKWFWLIVSLCFFANPALAQSSPETLLNALEQADGQTAGRIIQLAGLLTVLSLAPGILVTMTSFTRLIIALSFLRSGLGLPTTPSNLIVISLALFLTAFIMGPTFEKSYNEGVQPLIENKISEQQALPLIVEPFRQFMANNVRPEDVKLFEDLSKEPVLNTAEMPLRILVPAFLVSELRRGFEIGFMILLPFLVIDIVVATLT
ncbi:MAG: flagellar type III secretion system pore protein FliP, partial [Notoacmeibacter sp.]